MQSFLRYTDDEEVELWLGEAKFFKDRNQAISDAINSINSHITCGFLTNEKLLLGPQVSSDIPHSEKIRELLSSTVSLDQLIKQAIFPVLIAANSDAIPKYSDLNEEYRCEVQEELAALWGKLQASGLTTSIKIFLIYVPLGDKDMLNEAFDARLKGLQVGAP